MAGVFDGCQGESALVDLEGAPSHQYASIDALVNFVGPVAVLSNCLDAGPSEHAFHMLASMGELQPLEADPVLLFRQINDDGWSLLADQDYVGGGLVGLYLEADCLDL